MGHDAALTDRTKETVVSSLFKSTSLVGEFPENILFVARVT